MQEVAQYVVKTLVAGVRVDRVWILALLCDIRQVV